MNSTIRARAQQLVARHWKTMILMGLLIGLVGVGAALLFSVMVGALAYSSPELLSILVLVLSLVVIFLCSGLMLGYNAVLIRMNDEKPVHARDVFSLISKSPSAFGLTLWVGLKTGLWSLAGSAVTFVVNLIFYQFLFIPVISPVLMIAASIFASALVIRASFSYAMSTYVLADDPNYGVFASVQRSISIMEGFRFELFKLNLPYILIYIASYAVSFGLSYLFVNLGAFGGVLSLLVSIASSILNVYIGMLMTMATVSFYRHIAPANNASSADSFDGDYDKAPVDFNF